jgi:Fe-S-cluster-containing dehydrogenase component
VGSRYRGQAPPTTIDGMTGDDPASEACPSVPAPAEAAGVRRLTRRRMIGAVGVFGLSVGLLERLFDNPVAAIASGSKKRRVAQWTMIFDLRVCDGCKACTSACQRYHYLPKDQEWIKVYSVTSADGQTFHLPKPCMMCENPPCLPVCPVGATFRNDEGLVLIDQNVCIGCRTCMAACPYESRYFNAGPSPKTPPQPFPQSPEWPVPQVEGTVGKCILCAARLPAGMLPECVAACAMGAIYVGDLTTDVAVNGQGTVVKVSEFLRENDAFRLKEELGTNPRVYYIAGHGQDVSYD